MAYIIRNEKPYYFNGNSVYPCSVSAEKILVDWKNPIKEKFKIEGVYNENEIKHRLNLKMVDSWDEKNQKVVKVANQTISSIQAKKKKEDE